MKRLLLALCLILSLVSISNAVVTNYSKYTCLTGGTADCLDSQDGASLLDNDRAMVAVSGVFYYYRLNASSGAAESSPDVISPDANAGTKRWILENAKTNQSNVSGLTTASTPSFAGAALTDNTTISSGKSIGLSGGGAMTFTDAATDTIQIQNAQLEIIDTNATFYVAKDAYGTPTYKKTVGGNILARFTYGGTDDGVMQLYSGGAVTTQISGGSGLNTYFNSNVGIGTTTFGTSAATVLGLGNGTAPTTAPANVSQVWSEDVNGAAGYAGLHIITETEATKKIVVGVIIKGTTGRTANPAEGTMEINTFDNGIYMYAEAGWRTLVTW